MTESSKWWGSNDPYYETERPTCYYCYHSREREEYEYYLVIDTYIDEDKFGGFCYRFGKPVSRTDACGQWMDRYRRQIFEIDGKLMLIDYSYFIDDFHDYLGRYGAELLDAEQVDFFHAKLSSNKSEK